MSGHSKWSTIKHKKAVRDHARGDVFTKAVHNITVAAREGGSMDPNTNFGLRLAIEQAKAVNLPKDKIAQAIARSGGQGTGEGVEELLLEGFGAGGVAVMVRVVTNNRNRTMGEVKAVFEKNGGKIGERGSVAYLFEQTPEGAYLAKYKMGEGGSLVETLVAELTSLSDVQEVYTS